MHTDEYEISLSRELVVCKNAIRDIRKALAKLEQEYGMDTAKFVEGFASGNLGDNKDFTFWIAQYQSLKRWEDHQKEYSKLFERLKI